MTDEAGADEKILAVPINQVYPGYAHIEHVDNVPKHWLDRIGYFFEHYKDLEAGKWVTLDGWGGRDEARQVLTEAIARFNATPDKPNF